MNARFRPPRANRDHVIHDALPNLWSGGFCHAANRQRRNVAAKLAHGADQSAQGHGVPRKSFILISLLMFKILFGDKALGICREEASRLPIVQPHRHHEIPWIGIARFLVHGDTARAGICPVTMPVAHGEQLLRHRTLEGIARRILWRESPSSVLRHPRSGRAGPLQNLGRPTQWDGLWGDAWRQTLTQIPFNRPHPILSAVFPRRDPT